MIQLKEGALLITKIKYNFNKFRKLIASVFFFICIFIIIFTKAEDSTIISNIILAFISTGLFIFLALLVENKKDK